MIARECAEKIVHIASNMQIDIGYNEEKLIKFIESAILEAEAEGWKRGMEEAAKIADGIQRCGFAASPEGVHDWQRASGSIAEKIRAAIEKKEEA